MSRPWIAIAISFLVGAALGAVALVGALGAALVRRRPGLALLGLTLAAGGAARVAEERWVDAAPAAIVLPADGAVVDVRQRGDRLRVEVALDSTPDHRVEAWLDRRPRGLARGARVRITGRLVGLPPADNPGGFDAAADGRRRRVRWRLRGELALRQPASAIPLAIARSRDQARAALARSAHPHGAGVLTGLLLGDRQAVPDDARRGLERAGLGHLLAVSGLHVGGLGALLALLVARIGRRLRWRRIEWIILAVAAPFTLAFVTLAGFPLSACRAAVMIGLYLLGRAVGRPPDPLNLLGLAALWAVATRPSVALTPAFQLSFGAVGGLILLCPRGRSRWIDAATVALVAAIVTAPLQAAWFGTWAPIAAWANLALLPFALLLVPFGLIALLLAPITMVPLDLAAMGAELLGDFAGEIGALGGLCHVGTHGAWWLALGTVALVAWRTRWWRFSGGLAALCVLGAIVARPPDGVAEVIAIGQGDAILIRDGGEAILVDTGPPESAHRLMGALRRAGVERLTAVFISHGHPDHDGALGPLLADFTVDAVYTNGRPRAGRAWQQVAATLARRGVRVQVARADKVRLGDLAIEVRPALADPQASENDASVVLAVHGPALGLLLTGDLEAAGEAALVADPPRFATPLVLKAPHHGSKTSSSDALLDTLTPQAAVFTVGRRNRFNFPHRRVLARYAAREIPTRRTDRAGWMRIDLTTGRLTSLRGAPLDLSAKESAQ